MKIELVYDGEGNLAITKPDGTTEFHYVEFAYEVKGVLEPFHKEIAKYKGE